MSLKESPVNPVVRQEVNEGNEKTETQTSEVEYLKGWHFGAVGVAIVLSMFLVCSYTPREPGGNS